MNERIKTVFVKGSDGKPLRINESDYDSAKHGKVIDPSKVEDAPEPPTPPAAPALPNGASNLPNTPPVPPVAPPAAPAAAFVSKKGNKWVVVTADGQSVAGTEEYDTKTAAESALAALATPPAA